MPFGLGSALALMGAACQATALPHPIPLPHARHGHRIERLPDGWLCFGGFSRASGDRGTRETWVLPDGATTWRRAGDLVHGHAFFGSARLGGGGVGDRDAVAVAVGSAVEVYEAAEDRWRVLVEPGRLPQSHLAAAVHDGRLFVLGGYPQRGTGAFAVDVEVGSVEEVAPPPTYGAGDHFHFAVGLGDGLHVFGGMRSEPWGVLREHWVLRDGAWERLPDLPEPMWAKFGCVLARGAVVYVFGELGGFAFDAGGGGSGESGESGESGGWRRLAGLPGMVVMPVLVDDGVDLWVVGGLAVGDGGLEDGRVLWRYVVAEDRWVVVRG